MILGLFPELGGLGGVQEAGRQAALALARWAAGRDLPVRFLALNDSPGEVSFADREIRIDFRGFGRSKTHFVHSALRCRPDLVVALHPNLSPLAVTARAPTVVVAHGVDVWRRLSPLRRVSLRAATAVCAPSSDTAGRLADVQGVSRARIRVLPWAAPDARPGSLPRSFPAGSTVLTVARLDAVDGYKGVDTLIDSLPEVLRTVGDVALVVCGEGDLRPRLEARARARGVFERVTFLGALGRAELAACYRACEVFALPSAGEGFGIVFLEAMTAGKACIGGRHGGTPEVVEDGVTGLLVRHGDSAELAGALVRLLSEEGLVRKMGEKGRARARERYTFERFSERLARVLDEVLGA